MMSSYTLKMQEIFQVDRTIEDCFRYIVDFSTIAEWDHTVIHSEKISKGAVQKGTQFDIVLKMGVKKTPMKYEITEYDFPKQAVLVGEASSFKAIDTVTLKKINTTTTQVTWAAEITFFGFSAKLIPKFEASIRKSGTKTIEGLKLALEDSFEVPSYSKSLKIADSLIFPGMFLFTKYGYNLAKERWHPMSASIADKHIVLTGATSGIGLAAAEALAHKGAKLTLVARNKEKANQVKAEIIAATGNSNIEIEIADISLMEEVYDLAKRFQKKGEKIDVLLNNAGALFNDRKVTGEGLEMSFALLLLGPTILTEQLMPLLAEDARVINVLSGGMYSQKIRVNDLEFKKGKYNGSIAYARAKRGLMIKTEEWANAYKNSGITFNAMHPGWADTPGVVEALPGFYKVTKSVLRTAAEGADTIVWMATATEAAKLNGAFLLDRTPHPTHLMSKTKESDTERTQLAEALDHYAAKFKG
jgi:NAD(P)-dependent dehydrogenase (short-subunit alcohol dehydrogenase family)